MQGVKTYEIGKVLTCNCEKVNYIGSHSTGEDIIYQVFNEKRKLLAEIINCPLEIVYI